MILKFVSLLEGVEVADFHFPSNKNFHKIWLDPSELKLILSIRNSTKNYRLLHLDREPMELKFILKNNDFKASEKENNILNNNIYFCYSYSFITELTYYKIVVVIELYKNLYM